MNSRMDTIQAAILLEKLKLYDSEFLERNRVAQCYTEHLVDSVVPPSIPRQQGSVWTQPSSQVNDPAKLQKDPANLGIPTAIFYPTPIHLSAVYQHLGYSIGGFPVTEEVSRKIINLPMQPFLEKEEIVSITQAINSSVAS